MLNRRNCRTATKVFSIRSPQRNVVSRPCSVARPVTEVRMEDSQLEATTATCSPSAFLQRYRSGHGQIAGIFFKMGLQSCHLAWQLGLPAPRAAEGKVVELQSSKLGTQSIVSETLRYLA